MQVGKGMGTRCSGNAGEEVTAADCAVCLSANIPHPDCDQTLVSAEGWTVKAVNSLVETEDPFDMTIG